MMLLLLLHVPANGSQVGLADRKCSVSFLPRKRLQAQLLMNPLRRVSFENAKYISQRMRRLESNNEVDVIGGSANIESDSVVCSNDASKKRVHAGSEVRLNRRHAVF